MEGGRSGGSLRGGSPGSGLCLRAGPQDQEAGRAGPEPGL